MEDGVKWRMNAAESNSASHNFRLSLSYSLCYTKLLEPTYETSHEIAHFLCSERSAHINYSHFEVREKLRWSSNDVFSDHFSEQFHVELQKAG
jgi:hypothetical protein